MDANASYLSRSPDQTRAIAKALGARLGPGHVLALHGDLGAGKTCFCQGLAQGLGVPPQVAVTSPTYTMVNAFPGRLPFFHADLYRVSPGFDPADLDFFELAETGVLAVEWAERADRENLGATLEVVIRTMDDDSRSILLSAYGQGTADLIHGLDLPQGPLT